MIHTMRDEWSVFASGAYIDCRKIYAFIKNKEGYRPEKVAVRDISHKPLDAIDTASVRYLSAKHDSPVLLCFGMRNPHKKPYRMLDGRHRLLKCLNLGFDHVSAYIVPEHVSLKFVSLGG